MREYHKQVLLGLKFLLSRGLPLVLVSAAAAGVFLLKTPELEAVRAKFLKC